MSDISIQFGRFRNTFGKAVTHGGFVFMPANVVLNGSSFSSGAYLRDAVATPPAVLVRPIAEKFDAAWVRGRIPMVFDFIPTLSSTEKALLETGFLAVAVGASSGIGFICTDYYGRTGLTFSPEGPDAEAKRAIADAFWSLLLVAPHDLADFEERVFHPGAGVWMHFGCSDGEPTYDESDE